jgi:hypothetical protein
MPLGRDAFESIPIAVLSKYLPGSFEYLAFYFIFVLAQSPKLSLRRLFTLSDIFLRHSLIKNQ